MSHKTPDRSVRLRALIPFLTLFCALSPSLTEGSERDVIVYSNRQARCYLDLSEERARRLQVEAPVSDLLAYFQRMTGVPLPRTGGRVALFDPTVPLPLRVECAVAGMADRSANGSHNAEVALVLTPTRSFKTAPFGGPGEKVGWSATWHRNTRRITFRLTVANAAWYGPGYGPCVLAKLDSPAPDFAAGSALRVALEMRGGDQPGVRGGWAAGEWRYTNWFDPHTAGADNRQPGESDKNGPQAWAADWQQRWAGKAALYLTAYAPKGREARVTVDEVTVSQAGRTIFSNDFSAPPDDDGRISGWTINPAAGTVTPDAGRVHLNPQVGGWAFVGLRAAREDGVDLSDLFPLRLELREYPANVSRYDARTVQGFEMSAGAKEVRLRACTKLGLANAIYYLLDRWGCRWVMPGELGECIPRRDKLTLPAGTISFAPRSDMSLEVRGGGVVGDWYRRNMAGRDYRINAQHYWFYAIPPEPDLNPRHHWYYATPPESNLRDHPEWFSLVGGKRKPRQLCTSNPEVIARMTQVARDYLRLDSKRATFPMDPNDVTDFCQCDTCVALDVPGAQTRGAPSVTDRVLTFINAVAEGIKEEFPDRCVAFCAYSTHIDPPERVRPADNVIVLVCRSSNCLFHLTPRADCPASDFHALVRRWRELTPNVYTYEYDPIHWTGELPCPTYLDMARSLQYQLKNLGVNGSFSDATMGTPVASASWYLNHYMARRVKVDPEQDPNEVLRDLCTAFFGPAAGPMEGYYQELAQVAEYTHPGKGRIGGGTTFYHELFSPPIVRRARARLDDALPLVAGKKPYRTRVEMVDMSQRYLEAYLEGVWAAQEHRYEASVAAFDRMDRTITELESHGYINAADARFRARALRMKPLAECFPAKLGFVTRWELLGPFDNSDRNSHLRRDPFEPVTSLDAPVTLADGTQADWWSYESPNGFLNLERAFADKKGDWLLSYGYAAISYNAPRAMKAKLLMDSFFLFKVYVNGKEVFDKSGCNFDCPDRYAIKVNLRAGNNVIVVKLSHTALAADTFPWGLYLRVVPR